MIEFHAEEKQSATQNGLHQFMSEDLVRGVRFKVWDVEAKNLRSQVRWNELTPMIASNTKK